MQRYHSKCQNKNFVLKIVYTYSCSFDTFTTPTNIIRHCWRMRFYSSLHKYFFYSDIQDFHLCFCSWPSNNVVCSFRRGSHGLGYAFRPNIPRIFEKGKIQHNCFIPFEFLQIRAGMSIFYCNDDNLFNLLWLLCMRWQCLFA